MRLRARIAVFVSLGVVFGGLGAGASGAFAESPWWHLTSGARPSYLHAGASEPGVSEVQQLTIGAEGVAILASPSLTQTQIEHEEFEVEGKPTYVEVFTTMSAAEVQQELEQSQIYGPGNVHVEGGLGTYKITFVGSLAEQSVALLRPFYASQATVAEQVSGRAVKPDGEIYVTAENVGDANVDGGSTPVEFKDVLPKGLRAVGIAGTKPQGANFQARELLSCSSKAEVAEGKLACTLTESLAPYDQIEMRIAVDVQPDAESEKQENEVSVSGGGAPSAAVVHPVTISTAPVPFGVESYEMGLEEAGGTATVQAGKHPFQLTTTIALNQLEDINPLEQPPGFKPEVAPAALAKDLSFKLPPGLIGNPTPIPRCTTAQFYTAVIGQENECPADTAIGVAVATVHEPATTGTVTLTEPIFNLEPRVGEPARFGFYVAIANAPVVIDTAVRTGSDYGVTVSVENITQTAAFLSSEVTFWGTPGDPRHDAQRGWGCLYEARGATHEEPCSPGKTLHPQPFLSLPTSCGPALGTSVEGDSWSDPRNVLEFTGAFEPSRVLSGCNRLQFAPQVAVAPDGTQASSPTGLSVDVHVPQEVNANAAGLASSDVRSIAVTFPPGVVLNPAAADGLQACSQAQIGLEPGVGAQEELLFSPTLPEPFCPDASKVGTVSIKSPLLPAGQPLKGSLYLATPAPNGEAGSNPFDSLVAMYIVAKDPISGVLVKLPGKVTLDQGTGQITATFQNTPQLAFEDAEIHLFGGERAPLSTPSHCGTYTTDAAFTPWSGNAPVGASSSFDITSGPGGSACPPSPLPFTPSLEAQTTNGNAAAFSPLTTTISRADGQQNIQTVQLHLPPGLSGILTGVPLCAEAQANAGTCGPGSEIGHASVSVGLGSEPFTVSGGEVFLTGPYNGAPFGLSIVTPAIAGPFDLGRVVVRARIEVDPHTAALTVTTDPSGPYAIPHILDGIPLQIKHVDVTIDRSGFTFNPTDCNPLAITGTIGGVEGGSAPVEMPFQVANCATLKFAPKFTVSTKGKNSKANGATLTAKLSYPPAAQGTQANITRVKVDLPTQLPSRLTTLQKACTNARFEANPAACPTESKIGYAKVTTPLLPVPLEGPAIFVSHGGEAFPSLTMVLQGYGVTVDLVGTTFISSKGITSSTFKTVPDVPFNTFQLTLPQGKFSALAANVPGKAHYSLCGQKLAMPTEFLAQNGAKINESTKISVTGCKKTKKVKKQRKKQAKSHKGGK
jgi:hypothetical protein